MRTIIKILFAGAVIFLIWIGFQEASQYSQKEDLQRISETIEELSLKCYSIEGRYPKDVSYLKEYYGLLVNEEDYNILYHYEGDNLKPTIRVSKKVTHSE
ncbi:MAG: hypothetical protein ACLROI_09580 [Beduini sp.]|uniref:hypothetical protein n=1 Tax=Beduini sp. TaxID=1922300 RepID=UPI0011C82430